MNSRHFKSGHRQFVPGDSDDGIRFEWAGATSPGHDWLNLRVSSYDLIFAQHIISLDNAVDGPELFGLLPVLGGPEYLFGNTGGYIPFPIEQPSGPSPSPESPGTGGPSGPGQLLEEIVSPAPVFGNTGGYIPFPVTEFPFNEGPDLPVLGNAGGSPVISGPGPAAGPTESPVPGPVEEPGAPPPSTMPAGPTGPEPLPASTGPAPVLGPVEGPGTPPPSPMPAGPTGPEPFPVVAGPEPVSGPVDFPWFPGEEGLGPLPGAGPSGALGGQGWLQAFDGPISSGDDVSWQLFTKMTDSFHFI
jgi:hypothetical protein